MSDNPENHEDDDEFDQDDLHDELMQEFILYLKNHELWEKNQSYDRYWFVTRHLRNVRKLAKARQDQIKNQRDNKFFKGMGIIEYRKKYYQKRKPKN